MKKTNLFLVTVLAACSFSIVSCTIKDEREPVAPITQENGVPNGTVKFSLSVHVLASSQLNARVSGLDVTTVEISQNGTRSSASTDASGIAVFNGLSEGPVSIFINKAGFSSINTTTTLTKSFNNAADNQTDVEQYQFARTEITLPLLGASLKGKLYGDFDFNGGTNTTIPSGQKIIAEISNKFQPNVYTTLTLSDGSFSFTGLPEGTPITLRIDYQTTNTTATPNIQHGWTLTVPAQTLDVNEVTELGNITIF